MDFENLLSLPFKEGKPPSPRVMSSQLCLEAATQMEMRDILSGRANALTMDLALMGY